LEIFYEKIQNLPGMGVGEAYWFYLKQESYGLYLGENGL